MTALLLSYCQGLVRGVFASLMVITLLHFSLTQACTKVLQTQLVRICEWLRHTNISTDVQQHEVRRISLTKCTETLDGLVNMIQCIIRPPFACLLDM